MIEIKDKRMCSGCTACHSVCPKRCITMEMDEEGYLYPVVDKSTCINCGLCEKVCPISKEVPLNDYVPQAFAVQNKDEQIRRQSASGGAFTAFADYVIEKGGYVFGGAFDESFGVRHIGVDNKTNLAKLRCSKYVQSNLEGCFPKVKELLKKGKLVLFSGTPCQVNGVKSYLRKEYSNLITLDLVCHGTPSPGLWRSYIDWYKSRHQVELSLVSFRDKPFGYAGSTMSIKDENGNIKYTTRDVQFFKKVFFADINNRPSCFACHFKSVKRNSDLTLYDCWHMNKIDASLDDDKGSTWVIIQSERGKQLFENVADKIRFCHAEVSTAIELDGDMATECPVPSPMRKQFFRDYNVLSFEELVNKYSPQSFKSIFIGFMKPIMHKFGVLNTIKRLIK